MANLTLCARAICPSLLAAVILLSFSTTGFSYGDWPEGAHKEWFQNLQRPDNAQPPEPQLDPKSLFCCGAADVVKTKFKVEPAGGRCPDDVWYGWLNDTWTRFRLRRSSKTSLPTIKLTSSSLRERSSHSRPQRYLRTPSIWHRTKGYKTMTDGNTYTTTLDGFFSMPITRRYRLDTCSNCSSLIALTPRPSAGLAPRSRCATAPASSRRLGRPTTKKSGRGCSGRSASAQFSVVFDDQYGSTFLLILPHDRVPLLKDQGDRHSSGARASPAAPGEELRQRQRMWSATRPQASVGTSFGRAEQESDGASRTESSDRTSPRFFTSLCRECDSGGIVRVGGKDSLRGLKPGAGNQAVSRSSLNSPTSPGR